MMVSHLISTVKLSLTTWGNSLFRRQILSASSLTPISRLIHIQKMTLRLLMKLCHHSLLLRCYQFEMLNNLSRTPPLNPALLTLCHPHRLANVRISSQFSQIKSLISSQQYRHDAIYLEALTPVSIVQKGKSVTQLSRNGFLRSSKSPLVWNKRTIRDIHTFSPLALLIALSGLSTLSTRRILTTENCESLRKNTTTLSFQTFWVIDACIACSHTLYFLFRDRRAHGWK